jgi:hypothetical protein
MPTPTADKLTAVIAQVAAEGNADVLRLTVLKKWFQRPGRLQAFALWVAWRALEQGRAAEAPASDLFAEAEMLLLRRGPGGRLYRDAAERLHRRLQSFQDTYKRLKWGSVRIVRDANLMLIEDALMLYLWHPDAPTLGYRLAVDFAAHYDPHFGNGLNGPSLGRLQDLVDFVRGREALESEAADRPPPTNRAP